MLSIKQIRVGANLTIDDASVLCDCSAPTFAKWEKEHVKMEIGAFSKLLAFYNKQNPGKPISYEDVEF